MQITKASAVAPRDVAVADRATTVDRIAGVMIADLVAMTVEAARVGRVLAVAAPAQAGIVQVEALAVPDPAGPEIGAVIAVKATDSAATIVHRAAKSLSRSPRPG